jgi:hypothetical protein
MAVKMYVGIRVPLPGGRDDYYVVTSTHLKGFCEELGISYSKVHKSGLKNQEIEGRFWILQMANKHIRILGRGGLRANRRS